MSDLVTGWPWLVMKASPSKNPWGSMIFQAHLLDFWSPIWQKSNILALQISTRRGSASPRVVRAQALEIGHQDLRPVGVSTSMNASCDWKHLELPRGSSTGSLGNWEDLRELPPKFLGILDVTLDSVAAVAEMRCDPP